jgi:hypothetical protein
MKRRLTTKKVLVAAAGVGAISYVFSCGGNATSGNLLAPPDAANTDAPDLAADVSTSGNLVAPPDTGPEDAGHDAPHDATLDASNDGAADADDGGD